MTFEERLRAIIKANHERRESLQQECVEKDKKWAAVRDRNVIPALSEAARILETPLRGAHCQRKNGGATLIVGPHKATAYEELIFELDMKTGLISCRSSQRELAEQFEVERLTREVVESKVEEFVQKIT